MSLNRSDYEHLTDEEFATLNLRHTDPDAAREHAKAELAALRYGHEVAGIVFDGWTVATDRPAQQKVAAAGQAAALGLLSDGVRWKAADGTWHQLTEEQVKDLWAAVAEHVRACYEREAAICDALDALDDPEAILAYDCTTGWPGEGAE